MWRKHGLVVRASGAALSVSHAMLPTPLLLEDRIRLFFASCDAELRGRVFWADLGLEPPHRILDRSDLPVIDIGAAHAFDSDGINPSCLVKVGEQLRLYTIGWQRGTADKPYTLLAGIAFSADGGRTFEKQLQPLMPATAQESLFRTAPFVWRESFAWRMLYIAGDKFVCEGPGKALPRYSLKVASSEDGLSWPAEGDLLLNPDEAKGEIGFGRPVLRQVNNGRTHLILSIRTAAGYRLVETDWERAQRGDFAFEPMLIGQADHWDREMTCFGTTLRVGDRELLFYNGNGFGRTGIGLASRQL